MSLAAGDKVPHCAMLPLGRRSLLSSSLIDTALCQNMNCWLAHPDCSEYSAMAAQVAQIMLTLQQGCSDLSLMTVKFETGEHNSYWAGARQKALAVHHGHSQLLCNADGQTKVSSSYLLTELVCKPNSSYAKHASMKGCRVVLEMLFTADSSSRGAQSSVWYAANGSPVQS